jgi:HTH-type transcriptional regulator, quorum sensing regulator NprR
MIENFSFGQQVRYIRKEKKINQADLAKGICSTSYLSKIETGTICPSEDIKSMISRKLGLGAEEENADAEELLRSWYEHLLKKNKNLSRGLFLELSQKELSDSQKAKYQIFSIFHFIQSKELKQVPRLIRQLFAKETQLSSNSRYYFYKALGFYYYHTNKFEKSYSFLKKAMNLVSMLALTDLETADLYYAYALAASRLGKTPVCLKYAHSSLSLFQSLYFLNRCVDCHVLLGITYRRSGNFEEAIHQYQTALELAEKAEYTSINMTVEYNLGYLYGLMGDPEKAITHYTAILQKHDGLPTRAYVQTILSLSAELYKIQSYDKANSWIQRGLKIIADNPELKSGFTDEFTFYQLLLAGQTAELDKIMYSQVIPSLLKNKDHFTCSFYCLLLADSFFAQGKYKNSSKYYAGSREFLHMAIFNK